MRACVVLSVRSPVTALTSVPTRTLRSYIDYTGHAGEKDPSAKDGQGNVVGAVLVGKAAGDFKGGVAPGASLYWGRICYNDVCSYGQAGQAVTTMLGQGVRLFNFSADAFAISPPLCPFRRMASATRALTSARSIQAPSSSATFISVSRLVRVIAGLAYRAASSRR